MPDASLDGPQMAIEEAVLPAAHRGARHCSNEKGETTKSQTNSLDS